MTKSKVGAEPKKQRIRHAVTKSEGIHEGIHRDKCGKTIEAVGTIDI